MNLHKSVAEKMEYIQKVFLGVQNYMQKNPELDQLISFLDEEAPEFRSVAYESASMEIGFQELSANKNLINWKNFYQRSAPSHSFHLDIGLGLAFAKIEISPITFLDSLQPVLPLMLFDGVGYYHGLFRGRSTVKKQMIPEGIDEYSLHGFDQGLGRRLWYIAKGNVDELIHLMQPFHLSRKADLWRGVGIACGYVGGCSIEHINLLLDNSGECKDQFCKGISLSAISRSKSNSLTEDIELAIKIIFGKNPQEFLLEIKDRKTDWVYL